LFLASCFSFLVSRFSFLVPPSSFLVPGSCFALEKAETARNKKQETRNKKQDSDWHSDTGWVILLLGGPLSGDPSPQDCRGNFRGPVMPRIRDNIRDCAIYLYPSTEAARAGLQAKGSGFLVGIRSKTDENWCYPYAVTNRQTVADGAAVVRLNTKAGATDIIELTPDDWVFHPQGDDLAVASLRLHSDYHDYMLVNDNPMFLTAETMKEVRIGLGDEVFMVGRLIDHEGRQKNSPTVRFGQIAMMPGEPIHMSGDRFQECFLADVRSLGGLTGSPVFVTLHHLRLQNPVEFNHAWQPYLLGVNCGHIPTPLRIVDAKTGQLCSEPLLTDTHQSVLPLSRTGLMMVLPAWRLADLLNLPRLLKPRTEEDARRNLSGSGAFRLRGGAHAR
jgi:hypothetical protein